MIIQFIKQAICGAVKVPEHLGAVLDGSLKFRLKQMRYQTFSDFEAPNIYDHNLLRSFESRFNYMRIKHADRIGVSYWGSAKGDCNRTLAPVNYYLLLDGKKRTLQQQSAILEGNLELPLGTWSDQLDCLHTFVASSSKQKIVGQYVALAAGEPKEFVSYSRACEFSIEEGSAWGSPQTEDSVETFQPDFTEWEKMMEIEPAAPEPKRIRTKKTTKSRALLANPVTTAAPSGNRRSRRKLASKGSPVEQNECEAEQKLRVSC